MLLRKLRILARNSITRAEQPRDLLMNRPSFWFPWWTGLYPWAPFPPFNFWPPQITWIPNNFFGAFYPQPRCIPWSNALPPQIPTSSFNMDSTGDEPRPKRLKTAEDSRPGWNSHVKASHLPSSSSHVQDAASNVKISRHWEDFSQYHMENPSAQLGDVQSPAKFDFTVLSYNILSQDLLEDNSQLYNHCRRNVLFWSYRLPNILKEIKEMNADILCLQEVQEDHYKNQIKPSLEAFGYHCEFKSRTGSKPDGCAICFRASKFVLTLVKPVEYFRRNMMLLDRDNVGLILLLQPRVDGEAPTICVANTHLLYNPRRGDIKLAQLAILLAEISRVSLLKDSSVCPIILCGDFNSVPGSPLYSFIREGMLNYEGMPIGEVSGQQESSSGRRPLSFPIWPGTLGISQDCVYETKNKSGKPEGNTGDKAQDKRVESSLHHNFSLSSVYSHYVCGTGMPEVTTCHSTTALTVDYIFYSPAKGDVFVRPGASEPRHGLKLLGRLALLTEQDLWNIRALPNENNSSDHLSLLAKFRLEFVIHNQKEESVDVPEATALILPGPN
uniref:Angel homolog 2 n=1 Tax=Leptobrachium leishanense TaxID=445787 RepID=A0A8C5PCK7_9ANUR